MPPLLCPEAYRGQWFTDSTTIWPGNIWQTGWFLSSPFLCKVSYIHSAMTSWNSAYGTWGVICQVLTKQVLFFYSFPHANFCLHDLLPLTWHRAYPQDLGYVAQSAQRQELTEDSGTMQWWHGSKIEKKKKKKGGKTEGRRDRAVHCEGWKRPCWRLATGYVWHPSLWRTDEITLTFFSFQLKLHYHKDLMLGRSPYYSQGDLSSILLRASFCSLLFSVTLWGMKSSLQPSMYYLPARLHGSHFRDCARVLFF